MNETYSPATTVCLKMPAQDLSEDKDIIVNEISLIILIDGGLGGIDSGK